MDTVLFKFLCSLWGLNKSELSSRIYYYYGSPVEVQQGLVYPLLTPILTITAFILILKVGCWIECTIVSEHIKEITETGVFKNSLSEIRDQRITEYKDSLAQIKQLYLDLDITESQSLLIEFKKEALKEMYTDTFQMSRARLVLREYNTFLVNNQYFHCI